MRTIANTPFQTTIFCLTIGFLAVCDTPVHAQQVSPTQSAYDEIAPLLGNMPRPGNLDDVLACAGANEVMWVTTMKKDPWSAEANVAKRKAGWYAAVALGVFAVDSQVVLDAVDQAFADGSRKQVFDLARDCREAPNNWRE